MLKPTVSSQFPPFGGGPVRFKNNHLKLFILELFVKPLQIKFPGIWLFYNLNYLIICHMISITQTGFK